MDFTLGLPEKAGFIRTTNSDGFSWFIIILHNRGHSGRYHTFRHTHTSMSRDRALLSPLISHHLHQNCHNLGIPMGGNPIPDIPGVNKGIHWYTPKSTGFPAMNCDVPGIPSRSTDIPDRAAGSGVKPVKVARKFCGAVVSTPRCLVKRPFSLTLFSWTDNIYIYVYVYYILRIYVISIYNYTDTVYIYIYQYTYQYMQCFSDFWSTTWMVALDA
jgi:hypothetical protein